MLLLALVASWADAPAALAEALVPVEADLRACMKKPHAITVIASRASDG